MTSLALPTRSTRTTAAAVAYAGALLYVVLLAVLHAVQPHMIDQATISKYALGRDGWLLQAAFVSAGLGYAGLARLTSGRSAIPSQKSMYACSYATPIRSGASWCESSSRPA